jgi:hypothetical protein
MDERVRNIGIRDLVRLTFKSIDPKQIELVKMTLRGAMKEATSNVMNDDQIQGLLDNLAAFDPLKDTVNSVRPSITSAPELLILCNAVVEAIEEVNQVHLTSRGDVNRPSRGAVGQYVRNPSRDEVAAWDLINKS